MEEKYHPQSKNQNSKKGKTYMHEEDMLKKKLLNSRKSTKKQGEKNIEAIAYKEI
jgi:hypothetical protein